MEHTSSGRKEDGNLNSLIVGEGKQRLSTAQTEETPFVLITVLLVGHKIS